MKPPAVIVTVGSSTPTPCFCCRCCRCCVDALLRCCCCCCCRPHCLHRSLASLSPPPSLLPSSPWPVAVTLAAIVIDLIVLTNTVIAVAAALLDDCYVPSLLEEDYCLSPLSGKFPSSPSSPLPSLFSFPFCPLGDFDGTSERGQ